MELQDYFNNCKVYIWKETFAVVKSNKSFHGAFANIVDHNEITVIIDQLKIDDQDVIEIEKGWKILTFDVELPFELVGFVAQIAKEIADKNISILVISSFSTDHILVKENDLSITKRTLETFGCIVENK